MWSTEASLVKPIEVQRGSTSDSNHAGAASEGFSRKPAMARLKTRERTEGEKSKRVGKLEAVLSPATTCSFL
jgi:hypothetical protein